MNQSRERGAALIYVMVIFAAASVLAVGLLHSERVDITRTQHFIDRMQAMHYAKGAELYARELLATTPQLGTSATELSEFLRNQQTVMAIPDAKIQMHIDDQQGRFNVNSLLDGSKKNVEHFVALCISRGISEIKARGVAARLKHASATTTPEAAAPAPTAPAALTPKSTAAESIAIKPGEWLNDPSELVDAGLSIKDYRLIESYISAIPTISGVININTASDNLLRVYVPNTTQYNAIRDKRARDPILVDDFFSLQLNDPLLTTSSTYFRVTTTVEMHSQELRMSSLIIRRHQDDPSDVATIARSFTP